MPMPPALAPLGLGTALSSWHLYPLFAAVSALLVLGYGAGMLAARRHGVSWPALRLGAWLAGCAVLVLATQSSIAVYGDALFWMHMIQHLLLIMVAPVLMVLGAPLTLACQAAGPHGERVRGVLRGPVVSTITNPALTLAAYAAVIVGTHLTGFMNLVMTHPYMHDVEAGIYLAVGFLFFLPLVGREPIRWQLSPALRIVVYMVSMPVDTFTGVVLGQTPRYPWPAMAAMHPRWALPLLTDLHAGGAVMWIGGDGIMAVLLVVTFVVWASSGQSDQAELGGWLTAARIGHQQQVTGVTISDSTAEGALDGDSDAHLDAYNAYLARLNAPSRGPRRR